MFTFTVIAGLVTAPDDGVITMVDVFADPGDPLQPATTRITSMAPAIPMRVRNRWAAGIMNNIAIASMMKSTCRSNADGGTFMDCGGTMNDVAVMDPVAVAPGAGAALVVGTAHAESNAPGVQVKDTDPVNPPSPVMITGNVPVMPLHADGRRGDRNARHAFRHADGRRGDREVPRWSNQRDGADVAERLRNRERTGNWPWRSSRHWTKRDVDVRKRLPFAAITIGKLPLLQATVLAGAAVNTPGAAAIDAILSGALPLLPIETVPVEDVVSRAPGRVRLLGVSVMLPAVPLPVPVSATCIGWDAPSRASTMFSIPATAPAAAGVKTTPIVHEAPPASGVAHGVVPLRIPRSLGWCSLAEASSRLGLQCYS